MQEGPVWVALLDDSIVGTASAVGRGEDLYVRGMAVLPAGRGLGIGLALLKQIEDYASAQGYRRLILSTTPFLERAIRLYENFGFSRSEEGPEHLSGTPLFTMVKNLGAVRSISEDFMATQKEKAERFRALHEREGAFVMPNPWDVGSARLLASFGFEALATTSAGFANSLGRLDGQVTRDEVIEHCRNVSAATELPVSADLENCFAHDPAQVGETILLGARAGLVGGSIEDYNGDSSEPIYYFALAVERTL
jgi:N-acetylglutamate synthase-like GNAT family acetyltransferase